jgi:FkbM family methyltransferase
MLKKISWFLRQQFQRNKPIKINYWCNLKFRLYPEGQIAKMAYVYFFERSLIKYVLNYITHKMIVVDVGANIGLWSIAIAKKLGDSGKVYAFEPNKKTASLLKRNLDLNQLQDKVVVNQLALGALAHKAILTTSELGGDADYFIKADNDINVKSSNQEQEVLVTTLDEWAKNNNITGGIQFIKIDCEGSELNVLQGSRNVLSRSERLLIMCECNPEALSRQGHQTSELLNFLEELGFTIGMIDAQSKKINYCRPSVGYNGNFIAIKGA